MYCLEKAEIMVGLKELDFHTDPGHGLAQWPSLPPELLVDDKRLEIHRSRETDNERKTYIIITAFYSS